MLTYPFLLNSKAAFTLIAFAIPIPLNFTKYSKGILCNLSKLLSTLCETLLIKSTLLSLGLTLLIKITISSALIK